MPDLPEGLRYQPELVDAADEETLSIACGNYRSKSRVSWFLGKRRVCLLVELSFSGAGRLRKADDIPEFLLPLQTRAAAFANLKLGELQHVLVIEYGPGAGIGWHRDRPVFGEVVGVSLLAPCVIRFRKGEKEKSGKGKTKTKWERVNLLAEPRSAYHLSGPVRSEWQHSILRVDALRYSVTFRTLREDKSGRE